MAEKVDENVKAEETKNEKNEGGILADVLEGAKENWWKILLGVATTIGGFALGYELGSKPGPEALEVGEDDAPFDTNEA